MKGLFVVVVLCLIASTYAVSSAPNSKGASRLKQRVLQPKHVGAKAKAAKPIAFRQELHQQVEAAHHVEQHLNVQQHVAVEQQIAVAQPNDSSTGPSVIVDQPVSSSTGRNKGTPGKPCLTFTTCVECTDDESLAFYCMWSAARNVCQEDTEMDALKRSAPEDLWTKQCAPKDPDPIVDCGGCPILAVDKKPDRDIQDAHMVGSNGDYALATEGKLDLIGTDPNDPVTGAITHPNGTYGPIFVLPSIRDETGAIKDPVQSKEKLTYSPCVGDGSCSPSARFMSKARKGKFEPIEVGSDADRADEAQQTAEDRAPRMSSVKHVNHVDKVEMEDAEVSDSDSSAHDSDSNSDKQDNEESSDNNDDSSDSSDSSDSNDDSNTEAPEMSALEVGSRVAGAPDADGKFTPTFDDSDSDASAAAPNALQPSANANANAAAQPTADASVDQPRFAQSKRSMAHSMSAGKPATGSKEGTMEVTEYDDTVVGGKRIEEDQNSKPIKEEADDKQ